MTQPIPLEDFEFFRDDWRQLRDGGEANPQRAAASAPIEDDFTALTQSSVHELPAAWAQAPQRGTQRAHHTSTGPRSSLCVSQQPLPSRSSELPMPRKRRNMHWVDE